MKYEEILEKAMDIIVNSGESKSLSIEAIKSIKKGNIDEAYLKIEEAKKYFNLAHKRQTELITYELNNKLEISLILIHAQDHLSMANLSREFAIEFIELYKLIKNK